MLTLSVLAKRFSRGTEGGTYTFRSSFWPLLFATVDKEAKPTYKGLFDDTVSCARACLDLDLAPRVAQYRCNWHLGENAARLECFPEVQRVADFAHFMPVIFRVSHRPEIPPDIGPRCHGSTSAFFRRRLCSHSLPLWGQWAPAAASLA